MQALGGNTEREDAQIETLRPEQNHSIIFLPTDCRVDLSFLIDGSANIGKRRFQIQKQFLADVVQALDVGPDGPLMGVVQYG